MEAAAKREKEKQVIQEMISLYCRKQHHGQSLCKECQTVCTSAHRLLSVYGKQDLLQQLQRALLSKGTA